MNHELLIALGTAASVLAIVGGGTWRVVGLIRGIDSRMAELATKIEVIRARCKICKYYEN